ncbi:epoxide hydrolase 4-like isoform X2 [Oratosquilla oratoria]
MKIRVCVNNFFLLCLEWTLTWFFGCGVFLYMAWIWLMGRLKIRLRVRNTPPPCLLDESLGQHRFIKLQNIRLHYVESGCREGPLVLLLHGVPDFWYTWRKQLPELEAQYWVVAVDLRGCGDSDKPMLRTQYSVQVIADDITQLISALGRTKAHLVCMGVSGSVGWHLAYTRPHLLNKLVLIQAPHPFVIRQYAHSSLTLYIKAWYLLFVRLPIFPELSALFCGLSDILLRPLIKAKIFHEEDVEAYRYNFSWREDWTGSFNHLRQLDLSAVWEDERQPDVIATPTLLIMGDSDPLLPLDTAYRSAEYVERITIRAVRGGRSPHIEKSAQVNQVIGEYLREMPWRPLSPVSSSLMGKVMGAGLAAVSKTTDMVDTARQLPGGLVGIATATLSNTFKMAENKLGLDLVY